MARPDSDLDLLVILRGTLEPLEKQQAWRRLRALMGDLPVDLDLLIEDAATAEQLKGSRWHGLGHAYREGRLLYAVHPHATC